MNIRYHSEQKLNKDIMKSYDALEKKRDTSNHNKGANDWMKYELIKLVEQLKVYYIILSFMLQRIETDQNDKFRLILDTMEESKVSIELTLSRILAWNYFSEIQRLKEHHRSEMFILNKQIESLKAKLIEQSYKPFKIK